MWQGISAITFGIIVVMIINGLEDPDPTAIDIVYREVQTSKVGPDFEVVNARYSEIVTFCVNDILYFSYNRGVTAMLNPKGYVMKCNIQSKPELER